MTRFDSRLVYEQLVSTTEVSLNVSGNVAGGENKVWSSDWYDMELSGSTIRADVFIPGTTYVPTIVDGKVQVPCQIIYSNASFLACYPVIEVLGKQWRASISIYNNYSTAEASANRVFTFTVSEYLPPTRQ